MTKPSDEYGAGNLLKGWNVLTQVKSFKEGMGRAELYRKLGKKYRPKQQAPTKGLHENLT